MAKERDQIAELAPNETTRTRLTLDLSERLNEVVERIARERGMTKADVLRTAIEFLTLAESAKSSGMHVGAWKEDRESGVRREREFIGL